MAVYKRCSDAPLWISSNISPVRNHPSPVWLPRDTISHAILPRSSILAGGAKCLLFLNASVAGASKPFDSFDSKVVQAVSDFLANPRFSYFEILVIEAVEQEVQKIRNNSLSTFGFQKVYQMVVGSRQEFYQDFTNNTDTRLFDIQKFDIVKIIE